MKRNEWIGWLKVGESMLGLNMLVEDGRRRRVARSQRSETAETKGTEWASANWNYSEQMSFMWFAAATSSHRRDYHTL